MDGQMNYQMHSKARHSVILQHIKSPLIRTLPSRRIEVQRIHAGFISDFFMARSKSQSPDKSDKKLEIEGEKFRAKLQV